MYGFLILIIERYAFAFLSLAQQYQATLTNKMGMLLIDFAILK